MRAIAGAITALVLAATATAPAAGKAVVGDRVRDHVTVGQKQIPLPAGEWTVTGIGTQPFEMAEIGAFGTIENMVLARRAGDRIVAVVEINANAVPVNDGWGRTRSCERGSQYILVTRYRSGWDLSCLFVQATATGAAEGPPAWQATRRATAGATVPENWLTAGFRMSDRQDLVDIRYHFDPLLLTGEGVAGGWDADAVRADPRKLHAAEALTIWAMGFDGRIERGIRNQLRGEPAPMPVQAHYRSETPQVDGKLLALDRMHAAGALTTAEYVAQQRQALAEIPAVIENPGGLPLAMQKNISFRVFGSTVDYALAFFVTLSNPLSTYITASIVAIHSVIFVLNDNFWEERFASQSTRDANRIVDFAYIGGTE
ncbi:hypothetical protein [Stella sp.]|uniref:hypothetical protein n=1 Tax=Stella sp. TaxID=2912054 RepID=UPI0035B43F13